MAGRPSSPTPTNYLIDVENAIIVDVEATTAIRQAEVLAAKTHDRTRDGALRSLPGQAPGRQRLWLGRDARLAGAMSTASSRT